MNTSHRIASWPRALLLAAGSLLSTGALAQEPVATPMAAPAATEPAAAPAPVQRPSRQYTIEDFIATTGVNNASFTSTERYLVFSSNTSGIWNVYRMPVEGGEWRAITRSTAENVYAVAAFPQDDRILVTHDTGGDELDHLYVVTPDGKQRDLTPGKGLKAQFIDFAGDDASFFVMTNERDAKFFDVYRYDAASYERTLIYENKDGYEPAGVSRDGRWVALGKVNTTNDSDLYVADLTTGQVTHLSKHTGDAQFGAQDFSPDGQWLYYTTDEGGEFASLRRVKLGTWEAEDVRKADWDIQYAWFSRSGKYLVLGTNEDAVTKVELVDTATNTPVALPPLPPGEIRGLRISRSEKRLAFFVNGDRQPSDLFVMDLGGTPRALTRSLNAAIDPADLVDTSVVRFRSFDGLPIPNILWKPHQAVPGAKLPALVYVHGGPGGQTTRAYNPLLQYLANHGYVVLGINNRGSSGYGKTFFAADDGKHGREPLWDTMQAKKYLQSLDYVDRDRIGIIGGSYGGYMVLAALAFQPEEFKVGVDIFGVSNWVRTLESIPPYWESQRQALYREIGDPATQRDFLVATSPLFHADKIRAPLIVLQGANDPRVIKVESDEIVAAVKKNNVPVEYVVFADEGHGFRKKKNQIEGYGAILRFLEKHL